jgi:putative DNA primase/helicase
MPDLLPEHQADLCASGLTDATISIMGVVSVDPADYLKAKGVESAYRIPYLELKDCPSFHRDRVFPPIVDENGKRQKYDQPRGTGCRLFVMEPVVDLLQDFREPLFIAEGEKKCAAGWQAGLRCIVGVGGIWNFLDKTNGELIPEFDRIAFRNREIFYIPDSDVWGRSDLQEAIYTFGRKIQERGGTKFYFIQIPPRS